ncbi:MAG: transcriptional regulator [Rhizobacter sp.]|nr:transcriptional regulator [Chlorobiales bacterium]
MKTVLLKLVTIIIEDELESKLLSELLNLGATGYTVGTVRGKGLYAERESAWEGENSRIETLVSAEVADKIMAHLAAEYFPHFGAAAFVITAEVLRGEKYAG